MLNYCLILLWSLRQNKEAQFNKLNFYKITSGIFSEIYSVLNLKI